MAEYFSVDRTENEIAVLIGDAGQKLEVPVTDFEALPREGMIFIFENGRYIRDEQEEKLRKKRIFDLQKKLFKK